MEVKELGHLVLYVRDLERSRRFYRDVLGWHEVTGDVTGEERVVVGSTTVGTFVVHTMSVFSGDVEGKIDARGWLTRQGSLIVKEDGASDLRVGILRVVGRWTATLQQLAPA